MIRTYCARTKNFQSLGEGWSLSEDIDCNIKVWYFYYRYSKDYFSLYCKRIDII
jgi:hypothetical protein